MKERFEMNLPFIKNEDNLEMLKKSLESESIDKDLVPVLEKFFSLPITPRESCYGHFETNKSPYLSFVDDETTNEQEIEIQKYFKGKINELATKINQRLGSEAVKISLNEIDYGGGPKDYTLNFNIIDTNTLKQHGNEFFKIVWDEFSEYLNELK